MNPLSKNQFKLLERIGCSDAARKIDEIVREMNKKEKPKEKPKFDEIAEAIFEADTLYDAKEILFDYMKKIK